MKDIEQEYLDALGRLISNKPKNSKLKKKAKLGTLKISISSVAIEAGRSRTAIATESTKYPEVRARILEQIQPVTKPNTSADVIKTLRSKNNELRQENKKLLTHNANLLRQIDLVNKKIKRLEKARSRSRKVQNKPDNTVVPMFIPDESNDN